METPKADQKQLTPIQVKVQQLMKTWFNVHVTKFDSYQVELLLNKGQLDEAKLRHKVNIMPIEELGIDTSAMDEQVINNVLQKPLFIEIKELRNVSQPYQRGVLKDIKDDLEKERKRQRKLKNQTYQFKAHDGKRLVKVILLFQDQDRLSNKINEMNKFLLHEAFMSPAEPNTFVIDNPEQIEQVFMDTHSGKIQEDFQMMQGLPLKYTNAPRFVFLNENAKEAGEKNQLEQDDEFADLFKQFDVPDLTSSERTFIKRFEQLGFWRKRFPLASEPINK